MTMHHDGRTQRRDGDAHDRERIRTDLRTNLLVEAGAGSGKTTALVGRMLEHVRTGTPVDRLAAVTFTRKAAHELRERFQVKLEASARDAADAGERARYEQALRQLDRAFLGTIHSFCARLLRERPLEVGLDPGFQEVGEEDWAELRRRFWRRCVERAKRADDPELRALRDVGIDLGELSAGFEVVMKFPDVEFPLLESARPDVGPCRRALERLLVAARALMPRVEPDAGWDALQSLVRRLEFRQRIDDWSDVGQLCAALETISASHCKPTQNRWSDTKDGKALAKGLGEDFAALLDGPIADVLRCWREHRYPIVMRFLRRASDAFARERHATGMLGFEDLLLLAARLLREHPAVRDDLGARWPHLLVDEFQDTDPVQAEVCLLLASDSSEGSDWRLVTPRAGSLFVVGDPKQSIYRFRRADIQVYEQVKRRMRAFGDVLSLTRNFRSVDAIEAVVNAHFDGPFGTDATAEQAAFSPMRTSKAAAGHDGVYRYVVRTERRGRDDVIEPDAAMLASWIAERIARGERKAGDFLILTAEKAPIATYARALAERNVPVSTTGARLPQEHELRELLVVLRALADPENAVAVVAALRGLFFGLSPADLWSATRLGLRFTITSAPEDDAHAVARALRRLNDWWRLSRERAADVLIERILADTGLLFHAAGLPLGEARAGALLHIVEALRAASVLGASGVVDAMARLETLLSLEASDAPLRPGRTDAVRVMNLHRAKGLEADVVILAAPADAAEHDPRVHVTRGEHGAAVGGLEIGYGARNDRAILAHPPGWAAMQDRERAFEAAERVRTLYVAATRARCELVVGQSERLQKSGPKADTSAWRPLARVLDEHALVLAPRVTPPAGRRAVERATDAIARDVEDAHARVERARVPSLRVRPVTAEAKEHPALGAQDAAARGGGLGPAWGSAVHRCLEALGRGRSGAALDAFVRAVARDEQVGEREDALRELVARVEASATWRALLAEGMPTMELTVMRAAGVNGVTHVSEGVIDAAVRGDAGWRIVDWKTDHVDDIVWAERAGTYERQVEAYAAMLRALTAEPATGEIARVVG